MDAKSRGPTLRRIVLIVNRCQQLDSVAYYHTDQRHGGFVSTVSVALATCHLTSVPVRGLRVYTCTSDRVFKSDRYYELENVEIRFKVTES